MSALGTTRHSLHNIRLRSYADRRPHEFLAPDVKRLAAWVHHPNYTDIVNTHLATAVKNVEYQNEWYSYHSVSVK